MLWLSLFCVVVYWLLTPGVLSAQERQLRGWVVRIGAHGEAMPEERLPVFLKGYGARDVTTAPGGEFRLKLPAKCCKAGEKVTLDVEKLDWRIRFPLGG